MVQPNILVVCGRNKRRSRTAEYIFKNDSRFNIKSAGLSPQSEIHINEKHIEWADLVFVMDNEQRKRIVGQYRDALNLPPIEVVDIPDEYEYLDNELIDILTDRINGTLKAIYNI